ncbi:hypothetical protein BJX64DRAFT_24725 [Aspergillus heterothallicus]
MRWFLVEEGLAYYLFLLLRTSLLRVPIRDCYGALYLVHLSSFPLRGVYGVYLNPSRWSEWFFHQLLFSNCNLGNTLHNCTRPPALICGWDTKHGCAPSERRIKRLSASSRVGSSLGSQQLPVRSMITGGVPRSHMMSQQSGSQRRESTSTWRQAPRTNKTDGQYRSDIHPTTFLEDMKLSVL